MGETSWVTVLIVVFCYFIGNISPAILIGRIFGVDIKKQGSGNAGTTNVLRVLGKKAAVMTLLIDIGKGVLAVFIGRYFGGQEFAMLCGLAAFCGHIWPILFRFKGGKGVATAFGVIMAIDPLLGILALGVVLVVVAFSKRVSAGSLTGAFLFPFAAYFINPGYLLWACVLALIIIVKHRSNLVRLLKGQEPKLNFKK